MNAGLLIVRVVAAGFLILLIAASVWAQGREPFWQGVSDLLRDPWGAATMIDLYVGLLLFGVWIARTESNRGLAIVWCLLLPVFGNMITLAYVLRRTWVVRDVRSLIG